MGEGALSNPVQRKSLQNPHCGCRPTGFCRNNRIGKMGYFDFFVHFVHDKCPVNGYFFLDALS